MPEAVPRGLQDLLQRYGAEALDRIWIFPPLISGRRESGLLVASIFAEGPEAERRVLVSSPYTAERTGQGLRIDRAVQEQGEAPADRFPRVVEGVVRRAEKDLGEPREVIVAGTESALLEALQEYPADLLDPDLPPGTADSDAGAEPGAGTAHVEGPNGTILRDGSEETPVGATVGGTDP